MSFSMVVLGTLGIMMLLAVFGVALWDLANDWCGN